MCDIYDAKCAKEGCTVKIDMHLMDFKTPEEDIEVFCGAHLPKENVRVFHLKNKTDWKYVGGGYKRVGVRYLTEIAREYKDGNHPNAGGDWTIEDRK
jgi:hypothetical protein